jgi:hypothetical protein
VPGQRIRAFFQALIARDRRSPALSPSDLLPAFEPLYAAIDEPNNPNRPVTDARSNARCCLMPSSPTPIANGSQPTKKVSHFTLTHRIARRDLAR